MRENITLFNGDNKQILTSIPDKSIDFVLVDCCHCNKIVVNFENITSLAVWVENV